MELSQNSIVVRNLFRKRDLILQEDIAHEQIRSALIICGGGMRGAFGAGIVIALHRLGLANCFDVVVGISTGATTASYFLAGEQQTLLGTSIYYEECLNSFISFKQWPIANIDYMERVMKDGPKKLDLDAILKHRSRLFVGATDYESGEGHLLDVKSAQSEPIMAIKASIAVTELYRRPVRVNGQNYTDGSTSMPFPAKKVVESFKPTDILVIANCSQAGIANPSSEIKKIMINFFMHSFSLEVRELLMRRSDLWMENLEYLDDSNLNFGILWGPDSITNLTRDRSRVRRAAEEGVRKTLRVFGQPDLPFRLL